MICLKGRDEAIKFQFLIKTLILTFIPILLTLALCSNFTNALVGSGKIIFTTNAGISGNSVTDGQGGSTDISGIIINISPIIGTEGISSEFYPNIQE